MGKKRGPLAATDRRRNAGHKHPRAAGVNTDGEGPDNGASRPLGNLFNERRKNLGQGKRAS